jgi:transcriptional regulator with XRE-family HTH domain
LASILAVPDPLPSPQRQAFADNVRQAREKAGLTQEQLAWAAGLHQTEIARIEGGRRNPGLDTIFKVAHGLGLAPGALFSGIT